VLLLKKKNLLKIVLRDEVEKKSTQIIEKVPDSVMQMKGYYAMANAIKPIVRF
jgi:hypothetical protein